MKFLVDLHIHSRFSLATSNLLDIPHLDWWARKKGVAVVGTGDAVHPKWLLEISAMLQRCENGLYRIKKDCALSGTPFPGSDTPVYFLPTAEISCIYKRNGKVRKVHNIVVAPDFETFSTIQQRLSSIGNIASDGRPILGLDAHDLLDIVLTASKNACLIPAHIWTPWFSVLGSKSGFDTIDECFGDLSSEIFALETGLSSDPPMNRRCSFLDRYTLVSNSDAHSPDKLAREANIFTGECSYNAIIGALKNPSTGFYGTIEYFPEEGKYHLDGHRTCGISWNPDATVRHSGICPVCKKQVTVGVLNRVNQLADRSDFRPSPSLLPHHSLTGLSKVIAQRFSIGEGSLKVKKHYDDMINRFGPEMTILLDIPGEDLRSYDPVLYEGIQRLRSGNVLLSGGYDGVFGKVSMFY